MRHKSKKTGGYQVFAVTGTNTVSFAIDFAGADTKGLLGFAVERINHTTGERKYVDGYKVFPSVIPNPDVNTVANTYTHPVQSFVWDDFSCYDDTVYEYLFYPLKGKPKAIDRAAKPVSITVQTEKLFTNGPHDVFFNRGVASSQAYARRFFNLRPDEMYSDDMRREALDWLSRHLDDAILKFINEAQPGETLLGCFYEFRYLPVAQAFKTAIDKGVNVQLIVDAKENEYTDKKGNFHESFPRVENFETLRLAGIPTAKNAGYVIKREARTGSIQHNKFIVKLNANGKATEVWTGSTNISTGGIHGQTNVGHWIRLNNVAEKYKEYWELLSTDPGGTDTDDAATVRHKNAEFKKQVEHIQPNLHFATWDDVPEGTTPYFSPRSGLSVLESYAAMFDSAEDIACVTLAFGINDVFKDYLEDNTAANHISFMLLEKEDKPKENAKKPFRYINAKQNVYKAWGAYIEDKLYRWAKETSTRSLKLNQHVAYIHSKFLLVDPLSTDPVVVTGSANFSAASTNENDENMVIIRGNQRVADIYYTEFNRLFNHYYFRAIYNKTKQQGTTDESSLKLAENDSWLQKYKPGQLRYKRVAMFTKMDGFTDLE